MKKMTKLAALLAAILLLTAAMTACGGQSTEPDTPDDGQTGTTAVRIAPIPSGFDRRRRRTAMSACPSTTATSS